MKKLLPFSYTFILSFLCFSFIAKAQVTFNKTLHDFGDLTANSERFTDFELTNNSSEEVFIFRQESKEDCIVKFSQMKIAPGEKVLVRVKINPERKGYFERNIFVHISNATQPQKLTVKGRVLELDPEGATPCPNFNTPTETKQLDGTLSIKVLDKKTLQPIQNAQIGFDPAPARFGLYRTNSQGIWKNKVPIGLYIIGATAKGYTDTTTQEYISRNPNEIVFFLTNTDTLPPVIAQKDLLVYEEDKPVPTPEKPKTVDEFKEKEGELPYSIYGPNNNVFLIDVSSSMVNKYKLPLLKVSMNNLVLQLREVDKISIITYANTIEHVMPSVSAGKKKEITKKIDALQPYGMTRGGKGIREAYKAAEESYIEGGFNQIILATDGDFDLDKSDDELFKLIKEYAAKGIHLSVIGFGDKKDAIKKMRKLAEAGQGIYTHVSNEEEAKVALVEQVKKQTARKAEAGTY